MKRLFLCVFVLAAMPSFAIAQRIPIELKGVRTLGVVVEDLDKDAENCGITKDLLDSSVRFVIQQTKLRLQDYVTADGFVYVSANMIFLSARNSCVYSLAVQFSTHGQSVTQYGSGDFLMTVFERNMVGINERYRTPEQVGKAVEQMVKQFIGAWLRAN